MRLKKYIIKEATYETDKFFRDIAVKAYNKVKKILDKKYKWYEKSGRVDLPAHTDTQGWIIMGMSSVIQI